MSASASGALDEFRELAPDRVGRAHRADVEHRVGRAAELRRVHRRLNLPNGSGPQVEDHLLQGGRFPDS